MSWELNTAVNPPVLNTTPDVCQSLSLLYDTPVIAPFSEAYTAGRLSQVTWGHSDPAVCSGGLITEKYAYTRPGIIGNKELEITRFDGTRDVSGTLWWEGVHNSEGRKVTEYYPTGPVVGYGYDIYGRPNAMSSVDYVPGQGYTTSAPIVSGASYTPAGQLQSLTWLGYTETRDYNVRQQLTKITGANLNLEYEYKPTTNNGQVWKSRNVLSGEEVSYEYDALQRLVQAYTTGPQWGQSFQYDGFGNLYGQTVTKGSAPPPFSLTINPANNRVATFAYDANGNMTSDGTPGFTFTYDVENRLGPAVNSYDPANHRVWDAATSTYTFWSPEGKRLGRYSMQPSYQLINNVPTWVLVFSAAETNAYFGGRLIATAGPRLSPSARTPYLRVLTDRGGSVRWRDDATPETMEYFPYGQERTTTANGVDKFATYRRDGAVDYADQRYYDYGRARFLTADPYMASGGPESSSSWNRYAYTRGDPVNFVDPSGLQDCAADFCVDVVEPSPQGTGAPALPPTNSRPPLGWMPDMRLTAEPPKSLLAHGSVWDPEFDSRMDREQALSLAFLHNRCKNLLSKAGIDMGKLLRTSIGYFDGRRADVQSLTPGRFGDRRPSYSRPFGALLSSGVQARALPESSSVVLGPYAYVNSAVFKAIMVHETIHVAYPSFDDYWLGTRLQVAAGLRGSLGDAAFASSFVTQFFSFDCDSSKIPAGGMYGVYR